MSFALVLGGGGTVGVAWEVGVLAGLADAGVDLTGAEVVVGSSAGSVVGTHVRQGHSIETLVANQHRPAGDHGADGPVNTDLTPLIDIVTTLRAAKERTPEVLREVGRKAIAADTPPEEEWIHRFERLVGRGEWPDGDLRVTAVDCSTGHRRVWTADDGVALARAVASSCAIPGVFPPVALDGSRYIDGGLWSSSNLDVVLDTNVEAALFVGPLRAGDPSAMRMLEREVELVESTGRLVEVITPGDAFATEIGAQHLMNATFRDRGVELGIEDGAAAAARVRALLG